MRDRLVANWSIEATPAQWRALYPEAGLPAGGRVYVPALPRSSNTDVAAACVDAVSQLFKRWSPVEMLDSLAGGLDARRGMPVERLHVFPFGGLARSIEFFSTFGHHVASMQRTAATGS